MPRIVFSTEEVVGSLFAQMRALSDEILKLSDLGAQPLNPGESPDTRRHKIAKLGKQLAETCQSFDAVMTAAGAAPPPAEEPADPADPTPSQAN